MSRACRGPATTLAGWSADTHRQVTFGFNGATLSVESSDLRGLCSEHPVRVALEQPWRPLVEALLPHSRLRVVPLAGTCWEELRRQVVGDAVDHPSGRRDGLA